MSLVMRKIEGVEEGLRCVLGKNLRTANRKQSTWTNGFRRVVLLMGADEDNSRARASVSFARMERPSSEVLKRDFVVARKV